MEVNSGGFPSTPGHGARFGTLLGRPDCRAVSGCTFASRSLHLDSCVELELWKLGAAWIAHRIIWQGIPQILLSSEQKPRRKVQRVHCHCTSSNLSPTPHQVMIKAKEYPVMGRGSRHEKTLFIYSNHCKLVHDVGSCRAEPGPQCKPCGVDLPSFEFPDHFSLYGLSLFPRRFFALGGM